MAEHGFYLLLRHILKEARTHCHQRIVPIHPGGKGIDVGGMVEGDLGHTDARRLCMPGDGIYQPCFRRCLWLLDHLGSRDKRLLRLPRSYHIVTVDVDRELVLREVTSFLVERV